MKVLNAMLIGFTFITACQKPEKEFTSKGEITGIDMRKCAAPCCGGWFFTAGSSKSKVQKFPDNIDFDPMRDSLPLRVEFDLESTTFVDCGEPTNILIFKRIRKIK
jgi:hypothetical protein